MGRYFPLILSHKRKVYVGVNQGWINQDWTEPAVITTLTPYLEWLAYLVPVNQTLFLPCEPSQSIYSEEPASCHQSSSKSLTSSHFVYWQLTVLLIWCNLLLDIIHELTVKNAPCHTPSVLCLFSQEGDITVLCWTGVTWSHDISQQL